MKRTIETAQFITASAAFKGLKRLWTEFTESNPPFAWGDNNRTLVTAEAILNHLDGCAHAFCGVPPHTLAAALTRFAALC